MIYIIGLIWCFCVLFASYIKWYDVIHDLHSYGTYNQTEPRQITALTIFCMFCVSLIPMVNFMVAVLFTIIYFGSFIVKKLDNIKFDLWR